MKNKRTIKALLFTFLLSLSLFPGSGFAQKEADEIDKFMSLCFRYRIFNGAVLVAKNNKIIYKKSFGPANREWSVPNTPDTKFQLGSITKQFTALLVLQLAEAGKIDLAGMVNDYLPDYPSEQGSRISIHHLLCHSSGLPNLAKVYPNWFSEKWLKEYTTEEFLQLFCHLNLEFEPGSRFSYSNAGYYLLAAIVEKISDKSYAEVLEEKIFKPLQMKDSSHYNGYTILPKLAVGYEYWNFRYSNTVFNNASTHKGNGGMCSTVEDLYKWDRALYSEKLIAKKFLDLMFEPHMTLRGTTGYGYGWVLGRKYSTEAEHGFTFHEHSGSHQGFNNLIHRIPDDGIVIILLNNISQADLNTMREGLLNILYDRQWFLPRPLSLVLKEQKNITGINKALFDYKNSTSSYSLSRDAVNGLGFKFLLDGQEKMGIALLEFNAQEFPGSSWVYESLGEAYIICGNKTKAKKNLLKLLELDPKNHWAKKQLTKLK